MSLLALLSLPPTKDMLSDGRVAPVEEKKSVNPSVLGKLGAKIDAVGSVGVAAKPDGPPEPRRSTPGAGADDPARAAAQALRKPLEARVEKARQAHRDIAARVNDLAKKAAGAKNPADKAGIEKLRKQWEKALGIAGGRMDVAMADLAAIDDPGATREDLMRAMANAKSGATIDPAAEKSLKAGGDAFNEGVDTTVTTGFQNGQAETATDQVAWKADGKGLHRDEKHEKQVVGPGGASTTTSQSMSETLGPKGYQRDVVRKAEVAEVKEGELQKRSLETKDSVTANANELTRSRTVTQTKPDGSAKSTTTKVAATRGDGQAGLGATKEKERTDADGNTNTLKGGGKGGIVADDKSGGAFGEANLGGGRKQENGASLSGNLKIHGKVQCTVGDKDENTGLYPVTVEVQCGAEVSVEGGKENAKSGRSVGFEISYGADVVYRDTHNLSAAELGRYEKAMKAAASGKLIDTTWKEAEVLAKGVSEGWEAAQRIVTGKGPLSPEALKALERVGDSTEQESTTSASGGVNVDAKGVQVAVKRSHQSSKSTKATLKKDKQLGVEAMQTEQDTRSGQLGGGFGIVSGSFGASETVKTGFGFEITIDKDKDKDGKLVAAFARCKTKDDYEKLIAANKDRVKLESTTELKAAASSSNVELKVGIVEAQIGSGSGIAQQTQKDADGKVIAATSVGQQQAGGSIGAWGMNVGDSAQNKAVANQEGKDAELVLERQKNQTSADKLWDKAKSFVGLSENEKPDKRGALSQVTGAGEKEDLEVHDISGIRLTTKDLAAIAARAQSNDWNAPGGSNAKDYDAWRKARDEVVAAKGEPAAVAHALARFVGTSSKDRVALLRQFLRPGGKVALGREYAFPDELRSLQKDYERWVVKEGDKEVEELAEKKTPAAALELGAKMRQRLVEMKAQIAGHDGFRDRSAQADMVAQIAERRTALDTVLRRLRGENSAEQELAARKEEWDVRVGSCRAAKKAFDAMCAELEAEFPRSGRMLARDALDLSPRFNKMFDTREILLRELAAADQLADAHGFDKKRYAEARPDQKRIDRIVEVYGLTPPR